MKVPPEILKSTDPVRAPRQDPDTLTTEQRKAIVTRIRWVARHVRSLKLYTR